MVAIMLPDGSLRQYDGDITGFEIAKSIGSGLAKAAVMVRVNDEDWDLSRLITVDSNVAIITKDSQEALELLRHDCAHILAEAVQELFPDTQITFGPSTEDGFYYDFHRAKAFSSDDFPAIEKKMAEIIDRNEEITREIWSKSDAVDYFTQINENFKAEWVQELPDDGEITVYRQGNWLDLCKGPHLPSTGKVGKAFKLMKLAGAYWRGLSSNPQLQRIYGTCWRTPKELKAYLTRLEEAEKRDHRKIGRELDLFHLQEEAMGSIFWHPKGWTIYRMCETYMRNRLEAADYVEVRTPQLIDRKLWEKSGHWEKFREAMFVAEVDEGNENAATDDNNNDNGAKANKRSLALKPMNCPAHVQIFRQGITSYKDLPLRMAEFGSCHRYEPHGALHGIMRVRAFTQDDAHIFCTEDQIISETKQFCDLLLSVYKDFGFDQVSVKFSDRPEIRAGADATWDKAENALKEATIAAGLDFTLNPGEGAFYGPKLEFVLRDAIGRDWQCGTLQVDFVLPERLDASYIGEDGAKHRPVMLHRAILGSFERFIGILIEQYAGKFPMWLTPTHAVVATITDSAKDYAIEITQKLRKAGLRVEADIRNEKINYKIREHSVKKIPVILVVGAREADEGSVAIRRLGGKQQEIMSIEDAIEMLSNEAKMPNS